MDFLKTLAIPQSIEHFHVLILIGGLISIVLYPYLGFLLGSSVLSYVYNRKGTRERNLQLIGFAKDLIDTALYDKTIPAFLALLPSFSLVFVYAQVLQSTDAISVGLAGYGFLLLLIGLTLLYTYKYTFRLSGVLGEYEALLKSRSQSPAGLDDLHAYTTETLQSHYASGKTGIIALSVASFLIVSATTIAVNPSDWAAISTVFDLFISPDIWIRTLQFVSLAAGATGVGILYLNFAWQGGREGIPEEQKTFLRSISLRLIAGSLLTQPLFIVLGIILLPAASLSGSLYVFVGSTLILLFLTAQFIYAYVKESRTRFINSAVFSLALTCVFLSVNDQVAMHNATTAQAVFLAYRSDQATEELKSKLGVVAAALTGEDIYNGRCSACHLFDEKKIGPAYKDVIPKYGGHKDQIMAFVLNPVKKNPAFPPMPNQGLKQAEADSIVSYILRRLGSTEAKPAVTQEPVPQK
jgi:cytochrome c551/c552